MSSKRGKIFLLNLSSTSASFIYQNILSLASGVIVARILGAEGFGIISALFMIEAVALLIGQFGLPPTVSRYIAVYRGGNKDYSHIVGASILMAFLASVLFSSILIIAEDYVSITLHVPQIYIRIFAIAMAIVILQSPLEAILTGLNQLYKNAIASSITATIRTLLVVALVMKYGVYGYILAITLGRLVGLILLSYFTMPNIAEALKNVGEWLEGLREVFSLALAVLSTQILGFIAQWIDSVFVLAFLGIRELGVYSMAMRVCSPINTIRSIVKNNLMPVYGEIYGKHGLNGVKKTIFNLSKLVSIFVSPTLIVLAFLMPYVIPLIVGEEYRMAGILSMIYIISIAFVSVDMVYGYVANILNLKKIILVNAILLIISSIGLELCLLRFGSLGIILGKSLGLIIGFVTGYFLLHVFYGIKIQWNAFICGSLISLPLASSILVLNNLSHTLNLMVAVLLSATIVVTYIEIVRIMKIINLNDIRLLEQALGNDSTIIKTFKRIICID